MPDSVLLRVVVIEELVGNGGRGWVAQALEQDLAAQVAPAEVDGVDLGGISVDLALEAVQALGDLFDARDVIVAKYAEDRIEMTSCPAASQEYHLLWEAGSPLGSHPLGSSRSAEVRIGVRR